MSLLSEFAFGSVVFVGVKVKYISRVRSRVKIRGAPCYDPVCCEGTVKIWKFGFLLRRKKKTYQKTWPVVASSLAVEMRGF